MRKKEKKKSAVSKNEGAKLTVFSGAGGETKTISGLTKSDLEKEYGKYGDYSISKSDDDL